jgi:hypothetical protein
MEQEIALFNCKSVANQFLVAVTKIFLEKNKAQTQSYRTFLKM